MSPSAAAFFGNAEDNALFGNQADNILEGGAGDDTLYGGDGHDVAEFAGNVADFSFNLATITVTDRASSDGDGKRVLRLHGLAWESLLLGEAAVALPNVYLVVD